MNSKGVSKHPHINLYRASGGEGKTTRIQPSAPKAGWIRWLILTWLVRRKNLCSLRELIPNVQHVARHFTIAVMLTQLRAEMQLVDNTDTAQTAARLVDGKDTERTEG